MIGAGSICRPGGALRGFSVSSPLGPIGRLPARRVRVQSRVTSTLALPRRLDSVEGLREYRDRVLVPRLDAARCELQSLEQGVKAPLDQRAQRFPDYVSLAVLAYLVTQNAVLFTWVYVLFDWNLVEPITYLLGYSTTWLAIALFGSTGLEFTYGGLRRALTERRRRALYHQHGFDAAHFTRLSREVEELTRRVEQLRGV